MITRLSVFKYAFKKLTLFLKNNLYAILVICSLYCYNLALPCFRQKCHCFV